MGEPIITVENLAKRYILGHQRSKDDGFRHLLEDALRAPLRWLQSRKDDTPEKQEFWALKGVSFEVRLGEVVGIIGRNGAGKSTLLKVLSRITEPTKGRIKVVGRVASLLEVGTGFHPELTGRENIFLNGAILGMKRLEIKQKFDEIVAFSEVEQFLDTPVKRYSSGMYVRLAFAVAAHLQPEVLIIDEVLAVGDSRFQQKCLGKMKDMSTSGRTVLFVSHSMAAIQQLCSRAILIQSGKVQADGVPADVTAQYLSDASGGEGGSFSLEEHPSRSKSHENLIRRMVVRDSQGETTSCVYPDEAVTIEIEIVTSKPIRNPQIAIAVEDGNGRRIMTMATYFRPTEYPTLSGTCIAKCQMDALLLGSGRYLLSVSVGSKADGLLDSLDCAAWFEVAWRNHYGNGEPFLPVYGPVLKSSEWQVEKQSESATTTSDLELAQCR